MITDPGVYEMTDAEYFADPVPGGSLSNSGAKLLLAPSCPAKYRWAADHPAEHKRQWDIGHAAHLLVLGAGPELVTIDAKDYRTKAAQQAQAQAYTDGKVPLLAAERAVVEAMADALRRHPYASALFDPSHGKPEQSLFWEDADFGVWRRARFDFLPNPPAGTYRMIVPDYKSTISAEPAYLVKALYNHGYHRQAAYYLDGIRALGLADDATFVFVAQEKTAPYLITVFDLDSDALALGREQNRDALEVYRDCMESGYWPGYASDVVRLSLPPWAGRASQEVAW